MAPPVAAHSAIDLVRAGPVHSAAIRASVVGYAIPAAIPPKMRAPIRISIDGAKAGDQSGRYRQRHAEQQHELAAVAVAERAQPQHRAGQAQRVADRDQVELGLRGVKVGADGRQRDVRHRQRQVGDGRHNDQCGEDNSRLLGPVEGISPGATAVFAAMFVSLLKQCSLRREAGDQLST